MPAPVVAAAAQIGRQVVLRRLLRLSLFVLPVVLLGVVSMALLTLLVFSSGGDEGGTSAGTHSCRTLTTTTGVPVADLTAEQLANAQTIVAVGRQLDVPAYGWVIAVATALQESSLTNLPSGHLDSIGLFQQRAGWGPDADRLDPSEAARMFYQGGKGGQRGLLQVNDFESLPLTRAAQAVQAS